jgi:hypothetical protein
MGLITASEAETFRSFIVASKMKRSRSLMEHFRDRYDHPDATPADAFNYGACRSVFLLNDPNDTDKGPHRSAALEAFSRCVDSDPKWWLPRYLRMQIASVVPEELLVNSGASQFSSHDQVDPMEDAREVIALQRSCPQAYGYFLSPHATVLVEQLREGRVDEGLGRFRQEAATVVAERSPYELPYLDIPLREAVVLLRREGRNEDADEVKAAGLVRYPHSNPLRLS